MNLTSPHSWVRPATGPPTVGSTDDGTATPFRAQAAGSSATPRLEPGRSRGGNSLRSPIQSWFAAGIETPKCVRLGDA
jgi:hypothetical protein